MTKPFNVNELWLFFLEWFYCHHINPKNKLQANAKDKTNKKYFQNILELYSQKCSVNMLFLYKKNKKVKLKL